MLEMHIQLSINVGRVRKVRPHRFPHQQHPEISGCLAAVSRTSGCHNDAYPLFRRWPFVSVFICDLAQRTASLFLVRICRIETN